MAGAGRDRQRRSGRLRQPVLRRPRRDASPGWPSSKIETIPNYVDIAALDRPKLEGAEFNLGFIGMAPSRKRVDLALDVLEQLRRHDGVSSVREVEADVEYSWIWRTRRAGPHRPRVAPDPDVRSLRDAVVFDDFGPDVGSWLRRIGFVLSTSDDESFHLAPAEGMASGAVPQPARLAGSRDDLRRPLDPFDAGGMADAILSIVHDGRWDDERRLARLQAEDFSLDRVVAAWGAIVGGVAPVEDASTSAASAGTADPGPRPSAPSTRPKEGDNVTAQLTAPDPARRPEPIRRRGRAVLTYGRS